jgi:2-polyprenyl-6-methoxyphenol hydroxylase-like FAD-dependent oxidoreductase
MPSFEVVIVGAGIVGLAASIGFADKGHKVIVSPGAPYKTTHSRETYPVVILCLRS